MDDRPQPARKPLAPAGVQENGVEDCAEDVVLALVEGTVSDPYRACSGIAGEVVESRLGQVPPTVDAVHDLHRAVVVRLDVRDELHELVGLPVEVQVVERLEREGRVSHPAVAVVPVPLAAGGLRQRRCERGDRCSRRHVREALDRQRGALDGIAPHVVGDARPIEPVPPVVDGGRDAGVGVLLVRRPSEVFGPGQGAVRAVASLQGVPRAYPVPFDAEREVGGEAYGEPRARRVGGVPPVVGEGPGRVRAAIVEDGLADELDLDGALEALDRPDEDVLRVVVGRRPCVRRDRVLAGRRPHRQRVADDDPARRRLPGRHEDVGTGLVVPRGGMADSERAELEVPRLAIEERAEDAG